MCYGKSSFNHSQNSPFYSLMHDRISKFSAEFNGLFLIGFDKNCNPFCVIFSLTKVKGGVNAYGLTNEFFKTIAEVTDSKNGAFSTITGELSKETPDNTVIPLGSN